ncbi:hypothetical protein H6P81_013812 [Aristolochia fimbriata]|uniref:Uncharacterized protein n=1 Tax=Aristolochia fimbriata TaxID=158543 RepID=A0AAV7EHD3_ARIFI|nr:hypothetical protein H6P81_013812 [Aristolochia fimbriata]
MASIQEELARSPAHGGPEHFREAKRLFLHILPSIGSTYHRSHDPPTSPTKPSHFHAHAQLHLNHLRIVQLIGGQGPGDDGDTRAQALQYRVPPCFCSRIRFSNPGGSHSSLKSASFPSAAWRGPESCDRSRTKVSGNPVIPHVVKAVWKAPNFRALRTVQPRKTSAIKETERRSSSTEISSERNRSKAGRREREARKDDDDLNFELFDVAGGGDDGDDAVGSSREDKARECDERFEVAFGHQRDYLFHLSTGIRHTISTTGRCDYSSELSTTKKLHKYTTRMIRFDRRRGLPSVSQAGSLNDEHFRVMKIRVRNLVLLAVADDDESSFI